MVPSRSRSVAGLLSVLLVVTGVAAASPVWGQAPDGAAAGDPCEVPPPPPDYPPDWGTEADPEAEVPPPPPDYPPDWGTEADPEAEVPPADCGRSFRMKGGGGDLVVNAIVCDISRPFSVTGGPITVDFMPKASDPLIGGSYTYSGKVGSATLSGKGTYKLKLKKKGGGTMTAKGPGKVTSPKGTYSAVGTERYKLTPTSC